jgi:hypothetical protein
MPVWLLLLEACWVAGFVGLGFQLWFLSIDMLDNRVPGAPNDWYFMWRRRTPYPEELNDEGKIVRRRFYRLAWVLAAHFAAGVFLFSFAKSVTP